MPLDYFFELLQIDGLDFSTYWALCILRHADCVVWCLASQKGTRKGRWVHVKLTDGFLCSISCSDKEGIDSFRIEDGYCFRYRWGKALCIVAWYLVRSTKGQEYVAGIVGSPSTSWYRCTRQPTTGNALS